MRHVGMPAGQRRSTLSGVHTNCKESNRDDRKQDRTPLYSLTDFCPHSLIRGTAIRSNSLEYRISVDSQAPENGLRNALAEGVGFEPTIRFPVYTLSKRAPSATRPPLRQRENAAQYHGMALPYNPFVRTACAAIPRNGSWNFRSEASLLWQF